MLHLAAAGKATLFNLGNSYLVHVRTYLPSDIEPTMTTSQELNQPGVEGTGFLVTPPSIDHVLEKLRDAGHEVRVIGPFSNGRRLIEVDEIVRNYHELCTLSANLDGEA